MAKRYSKKKLMDQAKLAIVKNRLFFIEDIIAYLPISKPTFYDYFKVDSNEFNELKELLDENRIVLKVGMRKKWYDSNAPALQLALMKLIATPEELRKLSMQHIEQKSDSTITHVLSLGAGIDPNAEK